MNKSEWSASDSPHSKQRSEELAGAVEIVAKEDEDMHDRGGLVLIVTVIDIDSVNSTTEREIRDGLAEDGVERSAVQTAGRPDLGNDFSSDSF